MLFTLIQAEIVTTELYSYEVTRKRATGGVDIRKLDNVSEMDCAKDCDLETMCTGFITSPIERACWIKSGDFYNVDQREYVGDGDRKAADMWVKRILPDFIAPAIDPSMVSVFPDTFAWEFFYDHYDYAKGIDDLTNTIRSKTGIYDIVIYIDWFYAEAMDQGLLEANLYRLNELHRWNLSP